MKTSQRFTLFLMKNVPVILFIVIFLVFSLLNPRFFSYTNFENIMLSSSFVGIVAIGMTFVLITGGIDLSVGATMYITGAILAVLLEQGWGVLPAILVSMLGGLLWGCLNAYLISKVKIIPFMVTLGTLTAGRGVGLLITQSRHIAVPQSMRFGAERVFGLIPIPILTFIIVVIVAYIVMNYTSYGRQLFALGNDPEAAKKAGLNTDRLIASVYLVSAFCAALGAVIAVSREGSVSSAFGEGVEFHAIAASVLGGTSLFGGIGSVFPGTVIGTLLMQMIANGLIYINLDIYLQDMVTAVVIFFAVFIDARRTGLLKRLEARRIRVDKGFSGQQQFADKSPGV